MPQHRSPFVDYLNEYSLGSDSAGRIICHQIGRPGSLNEYKLWLLNLTILKFRHPNKRKREFEFVFFKDDKKIKRISGNKITKEIFLER